MQATDGDLYGVTWAGGADNQGTVFKITPTGALTTLASVDGYPSGALVQGIDGNFYGTRARTGEVFQVTLEGTVTTLGSVCCYPYAGLVQATDGNLYGTTFVGGADGCGQFGCGSVYEVTLPDAALSTVYNFCSQPNCTDGYGPIAPLIQATDGKLYGTTNGGGTGGICGGNTCGTVFSLDVGLTVPGASLSPTSLDFGAQGFHRVNTPQSVTLTNTGVAPLLISGILITGADAGDFSESDNCPMNPNTLGPGGHCSIVVVFSPTASGVRNAAVTVIDNALHSPQMVPLTGLGVGGKVGLK